MSFTITVPKKDRDAMAAKLTKLGHVKMHGRHTGNVKHESGLEFDFEPVGKTDEIRVQIHSNPENVPEDEIKSRLEADVQTLSKES